MKRACRLLLVLTSPLFFPLVYEISLARQSQGNNPHPMFEVKCDAKALLGQELRLHTGDQIPGKPGYHEESSNDSTSLRTNAFTGSAVSYFYEPFPLEIGSFILQLGGSFSLLPYPDAEQEIPIPGLDIQYKRGIFRNISLVASFSTSIFSNLFHGGIQWNANLDRFSAGFASHIGFAYGFITRENLFDDVQAYGLFCMPIVRFGYRFDDFSFSGSFVITYVFKSASYVNGLRASVGPQNSINDYYCTFVVEQPFLRHLHVSIGFSMGYARTPYQSWMLYNTVDEWLFVPEFFFAVQL